MGMDNKMSHLSKHFVLKGSPHLLSYWKEVSASHKNKKHDDGTWNERIFVASMKTYKNKVLSCKNSVTAGDIF